MPTITTNKTQPISLSRYYINRKKILIKRNTGGLGDIFMHRMIFEDFKLLMPDSHLTFACPPEYFDAVSDHPFIDEIVDHHTANPDDFGVAYNTSWACNEHELKMAPYSDKHRSDIWANHCGVNLTKHHMNFRLTMVEQEWAQAFVKKLNPDNRKTILVAPLSSMTSKNMLPEQINPVIEILSKDYCVFGIHNQSLSQYSMPGVSGLNIRQFISIINEVDYVISVDTSTFHCAGGLGKPMVAIFAWADGKVYSKYYPKTCLVQKHRDDTPGWNCGPCYCFTSCCKLPNQLELRKPCITEITPDMILNGFRRISQSD